MEAAELRSDLRYGEALLNDIEALRMARLSPIQIGILRIVAQRGREIVSGGSAYSSLMLSQRDAASELGCSKSGILCATRGLESCGILRTVRPSNNKLSNYVVSWRHLERRAQFAIAALFDESSEPQRAPVDQPIGKQLHWLDQNGGWNSDWRRLAEMDAKLNPTPGTTEDAEVIRRYMHGRKSGTGTWPPATVKDLKKSRRLIRAEIKRRK